MIRENRACEKGCDPQLFDEPTEEWGLEQLNSYARATYRQILEGEESLASAYWSLGHALDLARKAFRHGVWTQHLRDLGIDKTRASKARAIYRTFGEKEDVAGLTVAEAYERRSRQRPATSGDERDCDARSDKNVQQMRKAVRSIGKRTERVVESAATVRPEEALILIPAVRKVIRQLQELLRRLEPTPPENEL